MADDQRESALIRALKASMKIPGAKVHRDTFLQEQLSKHCSEEVVNKAIESRPALAGVHQDTIDRIARGVINRHTGMVTGGAFAAGLPPGWWVLPAIPADVAQFYWHVLVVVQKLAYLYGWPNLFEDKSDGLDDESAHLVALFIGVMLGVGGANEAIGVVVKGLEKELIRQIKRVRLTDYGIYQVAKQIGRWLGIKVTRENLIKGTVKVVPLLGAIVNAAITFATFKPMSVRLRRHLSKLSLAK